METIPTIKGIFVNSHIKRLRQEKGEDAVQELERRYGKSVTFGNNDEVPVREEVRIIECVLDILSGETLTPSMRSFEAGKLHFTNFVNTPLAKIIFSLFKQNFKLLMLNSGNIAGHVFKGVKFHSSDLGPSLVEVSMENNDYPIEHFQGFFQAWMDFSGLTGKVMAEKKADRYVYTMAW